MKRSLLPVLLALAALALPACRQGLAGGRPKTFGAVGGEDVPPLTTYHRDVVATPARSRDTPPAPRKPVEIPGKIPGTPSIRVVWEALAVEMERSTGENRGVKGSTGLVEGLPGTKHDVDFEAVLVNASFSPTPDQDAENRAPKAVGRVARVADQEMNDLLAGLERLGFWKYARPTDEVRMLFPTERARGRITVERGGESMTLVSMRGLGLNPATREIPGIYSQAKLAIQMLKNQTPTLRVKSVDIEPLNPPPSAGGTGGGKSGK